MFLIPTDLSFWKAALERAVKTAVQAVVLAIGAAQGAALFALDWKNVVGAAVGGAAVSLLTSLISLPIGPADSPSVISEPATATSPAASSIGKTVN
jgi:hypothetical protein